MSDVEKSLSETASADVPEERETDEAGAVESEKRISLADPSCWRLTPDRVVPCVEPPEQAGATFIID